MRGRRTIENGVPSRQAARDDGGEAALRTGRVGVLADVGTPVLTLITCYPFGYVGPAPKRFDVRAWPVTRDAESLPISSR
jgi:hypothetical protein